MEGKHEVCGGGTPSSSRSVLLKRNSSPLPHYTYTIVALIWSTLFNFYLKQSLPFVKDVVISYIYVVVVKQYRRAVGPPTTGYRQPSTTGIKYFNLQSQEIDNPSPDNGPNTCPPKDKQLYQTASRIDKDLSLG